VSAEILIYAIIAAGLVFWLRNVLGTRHGSERERPNPFTSQPDTIKPARQPAAAASPTVSAAQNTDINAGLERNMSIENELAEKGLVDIARADHSFDLPHFLRGAQDAFIMIIESFAAGDKEALKSLLADPVYKAFEQVIDERIQKGEKANVEIHSIRKTEVVKAWIKDKTALITIRFTADETSLVRDKDDIVIYGNPERITETIDIWTFGRPLKSRDPVWILQETREDEKDTLSGSTVPDVTE